MFTRLYEKLFVDADIRELLNAYRNGLIQIVDHSISYEYDNPRCIQKHSSITFVTSSGNKFSVNPSGRVEEIHEDEFRQYHFGISLARLFNIAYADLQKKKRQIALENDKEHKKNAKEFINRLLG